MGHPLQIEYGGAETHSEKSNESAERTGKQNLQEAAEGTGVVFSGEKEGRPHCSLQLRETRLQWVEHQILFWSEKWYHTRKWSQVAAEAAEIGYWEDFLHGNGG